MNGQIAAGRSRVVRAASARAAIEHPNLVGMRVDSADGGRVSLLMERCPAPSLEEVLSRGPLTVTDFVPMLRDIASAVDALTRHGLVAHDLTPGRILLHPTRGALLADPGIPLALVRRAPDEGDRDRPYRSPEELDGRSVDARSNVYSLGAILFAALAGRPPPESGRGWRRSRRPAALPAALAAVTARAMARKPADRYSDVEELVCAVLAAVGVQAPATSESSRPDPAASQPATAGRTRSKAPRRRLLRVLARSRPPSIPNEPEVKPRRKSQPDLRALLDQEDVEGLVQAVGFQDVEQRVEGHPVDWGTRVREQAVLALGELGPDAGGEAVTGALHDPYDRVRSAAVQVLRSRGQIGLLAPALSSFPPEGEKSRELAFQAILEHRSARLARAAAGALLRAPGDAPLSEGDAAFLFALAESEEGGKPATAVVRELLKALSDDRSEVAERAEEALVKLAPASTPGVIAELEKDRPPERAAAVLGRIGDSGALQPLIEALERPDAGVRVQAAAALGALRDPAAVEPLLRATRDSEINVRAEASLAIDQMGAAGVIVGMSALLRSMVMEAVASVAELPPPGGAAPVVAQISAPDPGWRFDDSPEATSLPDDASRNVRPHRDSASHSQNNDGAPLAGRTVSDR